MLHELILAMGRHFSPEQYLFWTHAQCLAWTAADLCVVYFLLRLANLARSLLGRRLHRGSYGVLALTALLAPLVPMAHTGWTIFVLELAITIPHFALILYVIAAAAKYIPEALRKVLDPSFASPK
jgi:hypothetical protein